MSISDICGYIMVFSVLATPVLTLIFLIRWIMRKPKKKFGIAILVCIGIFILSALIGVDASTGTRYTGPVVSFVVIETFLFGVAIKDRKSRRIENIISAKVVNRRQVMVGRHEYSGVSLGWHGGLRTHWAWRKVPSYVEVWVDVVYKNGQRRQLWLREGSRKYYRVMAICEKCEDT